MLLFRALLSLFFPTSEIASHFHFLLLRLLPLFRLLPRPFFIPFALQNRSLSASFRLLCFLCLTVGYRRFSPFPSTHPYFSCTKIRELIFPLLPSSFPSDPEIRPNSSSPPPPHVFAKSPYHACWPRNRINSSKWRRRRLRSTSILLPPIHPPSAFSPTFPTGRRWRQRDRQGGTTES